VRLGEGLGAPPPPPPPLPCAICGTGIRDGEPSVEVTVQLARGAGLQLAEAHERCVEIAAERHIRPAP
jgi:hypothetical protein